MVWVGWDTGTRVPFVSMSGVGEMRTNDSDTRAGLVDQEFFNAYTGISSFSKFFGGALGLTVEVFYLPRIMPEPSSSLIRWVRGIYSFPCPKCRLSRVDWRSSLRYLPVYSLNIQDLVRWTLLNLLRTRCILCFSHDLHWRECGDIYSSPEIYDNGNSHHCQYYRSRHMFSVLQEQYSPDHWDEETVSGI